jgi:beta-lactamase class A
MRINLNLLSNLTGGNDLVLLWISVILESHTKKRIMLQLIKMKLMLFLLLPLTVLGQQQTVGQYLEQLPKSLSVSFTAHSIEEGASPLVYNQEKRVPSASIIKIPILMALMEAVAQGELDLDEEYVLLEEDIVGGAGEIQHSMAGEQFSFDFLAREMIRISDNTATNIIINRIGKDRVNSVLQTYGCKDTQLNRKMMDFEAIKEGKQNFTSSKEMAELLGWIYNGEGMSAKGKEYILDLLFGCEDKDAIGAGLPDYELAHKTGTLEYIRGDAGIVFAEKPVVIVVFVENFSSLEQADEVIANLSRLLFAAVSG